MKHYEILYILKPDFTEEEMAAKVAEVDSLIKNEGGLITFSEMLGKKKLAYPIKKMTFGFYQLSEFDTLPEKLPALEKNLRLMTEILRFLIVIKKKTVEKPRIISKPKPVETPAPRLFKKEPTKEMVKEKAKKVSIEDLDKKLDEILGDDIVKE